MNQLKRINKNLTELDLIQGLSIAPECAFLCKCLM